MHDLDIYSKRSDRVVDIDLHTIRATLMKRYLELEDMRLALPEIGAWCHEQLIELLPEPTPDNDSALALLVRECHEHTALEGERQARRHYMDQCCATAADEFVHRRKRVSKQKYEVSVWHRALVLFLSAEMEQLLGERFSGPSSVHVEIRPQRILIKSITPDPREKWPYKMDKRPEGPMSLTTA